MAVSVNTTGKLREFLVNMMLGVKNGDIKPEEARGIVKFAAQVNESFYAEIKYRKTQIEAGAKAAEMGMMPIGEK